MVDVPWTVRRSRMIAAGLSAGALVSLVGGMVATDHPPVPPTGAGPPTVSSPDPFGAGGPAVPPSRLTGQSAQTITSAS